MAEIKILPDGKTVSCDNGTTILQASLKAGVPHSYICGGKTRCTTCRVVILDGLENCAPRNDKESAIASQLHFSHNTRLACQTTVNGNVSLRRLVLDENDIAFTSQQIVERVRSEVLAMQSAADITRVVGVLWEGLNDVGIYADYCAIDIVDAKKDTGTVYAAARSWLEDQYGVKPVERNILPKLHSYHKDINCDSLPDGRPLPREFPAGFSSEDTADYPAYFQAIWQNKAADNRKTPRAWIGVPFSHGLLIIHTFRKKGFPVNAVRVLQSFADAVSLAWARFLDFKHLAEHNAALQEAYTKLQDMQVELVQASKMAALGQLVSGIAHEINTPLGALQSSLDTYNRMILKLQETFKQVVEDAEKMPSKAVRIFGQYENLEAASRGALERIDSIIRGMRQFARLDRAARDTFDVHEGLDATVSLISPELGDRITVKKEYGELPLINCFPGKLNQAFMNILLNAAAAIEEKGEIVIRTASLPEGVTIEIADSGVGIPAENLEKIFDPGFTTKGVGYGAGMGLSIVYTIIQDHQGKIAIDSVTGKGTTVKIELPVT